MPKHNVYAVKPEARYGRLTVISFVGKESPGRYVWAVKCDCGKVKTVTSNKLLSGLTVSCGCHRIELATKHGASKKTEYAIYRSMIQRCTNPNNTNFKHYGARGIKVCDRWLSFKPFFEDMGSRPSLKHTLERVDNNKGYSPDNCVWATMKQQSSNKRNTVFIECNGVVRTASELASIVGISRSTLLSRYRSGWPMEHVVSRNVGEHLTTRKAAALGIQPRPTANSNGRG